MRLSDDRYRVIPRVKTRSLRPTEEALQRACIEWAGWQSHRYPQLAWIIHVPNGGKRPRGEAGKLRAMGVKRGVPDLMLPLPSPSGIWRGLAVELKSENGRLSDDQFRWLEQLAMAGWCVGVARSLERFIAIARNYLEEKHE